VPTCLLFPGRPQTIYHGVSRAIRGFHDRNLKHRRYIRVYSLTVKSTWPALADCGSTHNSLPMSKRWGVLNLIFCSCPKGSTIQPRTPLLLEPWQIEADNTKRETLRGSQAVVWPVVAIEIYFRYTGFPPATM